jgi:putative effector of murein hydrolase LrgA (UPF0299 family)
MDGFPEPGRSEARSRSVALALFAAVFAVVLWGGYSHRWSWTGINGTTATLWDWLHLLLLPLAVAVLPIWLSRDTRLPRRYKLLSATALALFALVVLAGYAIPWAWTGFVGNSLWDWLNLLALPVAVALMPIYRELRAAWTPRHSAAITAGLGVFAVFVLGGYLGHWHWTGFTGNTLWDWLHLLLLPLLLPTLVVPLMMPMATSRLDLVRPARAPAEAADDVQPPTAPEEGVSPDPESRRSAAG